MQRWQLQNISAGRAGIAGVFIFGKIFDSSRIGRLLRTRSIVCGNGIRSRAA